MNKPKTKALKQHPVGSKVQNWTLLKEKQKGVDKLVIRRWVTLPDGKALNERYPTSFYSTLSGNPEELKKLVLRLNNDVNDKLKRKKKIILQHAYIDPELLKSYHEHLSTRVPSKQGVSKEYGYLFKYFLNFFISRMNLESPLEWHLNQHAWCWALLNQFPIDKKEEALRYRIWEGDHVPSGGTIKEIVQAANRFMIWLHQRRPLDTNALLFDPVSKAQFKTLAATRERLELDDDGVYIPDEDWNEIKKNLPDEIVPFVMLAYHYGLRRGETLGALEEDVLEDCLLVKRQISGITKSEEKRGARSGIPRYANVKGKMKRSVPHWFATPDETFEWITSAFENKYLVHRDTLSKRWNAVMDALNMDYGIHDLRHTFTTNAVMRFTIAEVMLAAGHQNIETTMRYFHDSRKLSQKRFVPKKKNSA